MLGSEGIEIHARQGVKVRVLSTVVQTNVDNHRKCSDSPTSYRETNQTVEQIFGRARDPDGTIKTLC